MSLDEVLILAKQLRPVDQARLVARLAPQVERVLEQVDPSPLPHPSLRGLLADLGPAPSAQDIDTAQREMWAAFALE
ncbi:MAG: hypothetical protein HS099_06685 [Ardenticatenaceae bacterium]|nr:hypothetical protein [Ardenticatenaceae bacterium]